MPTQRRNAHESPAPIGRNALQRHDVKIRDSKLAGAVFVNTHDLRRGLSALIQDLPGPAEKSPIFASERKLPRCLRAVKPADPYPRSGLTLFCRNIETPHPPAKVGVRPRNPPQAVDLLAIR